MLFLACRVSKYVKYSNLIFISDVIIKDYIQLGDIDKKDN